MFFLIKKKKMENADMLEKYYPHLVQDVTFFTKINQFFDGKNLFMLELPQSWLILDTTNTPIGVAISGKQGLQFFKLTRDDRAKNKTAMDFIMNLVQDPSLSRMSIHSSPSSASSSPSSSLSSSFKKPADIVKSINNAFNNMITGINKWISKYGEKKAATVSDASDSTPSSSLSSSTSPSPSVQLSPPPLPPRETQEKTSLAAQRPLPPIPTSIPSSVTSGVITPKDLQNAAAELRKTEKLENVVSSSTLQGVTQESQQKLEEKVRSAPDLPQNAKNVLLANIVEKSKELSARSKNCYDDRGNYICGNVKQLSGTPETINMLQKSLAGDRSPLFQQMSDALSKRRAAWEDMETGSDENNKDWDL